MAMVVALWVDKLQNCHRNLFMNLVANVLHVQTLLYSVCVCVFALQPLYLRVQAISERIPEEIKEEIQRAKAQLDGKVFCCFIDYTLQLLKDTLRLL
ncbi:hypothetical protein RHSIM_Rhsim08G0135700 [Rhododendron simsii]|uniref:Uncharacterized protein n=1 Tax=Rhododendron simsii TaxID=118357 RepID=A0A834GI35_RHOSS|nr:hypothetical protein RHSIM_Rhsim08G0135700 [Rhododendron simsii]